MGQLNHSPSDILRRVLVALSDGTLPSAKAAWPIHSNGMVNKPDSQISVNDTQGRTQGRTMTDGEVITFPGVQIMIRAAKPHTAFTKAGNIVQTLDEDINRTSVTIDSNEYQIQAVTRTSDPIFLGEEDGSNRHLYAINAIMSVRETT
jgi:hypothetical protein